MSQPDVESLRRAGAGWSGREHNHLFMTDASGQYTDVSGVSGLDVLGDTRTHVLWDYDHDGACDVALTNANAPRVQVFRNQTPIAPDAGRFVAFRLVGGNATGAPSPMGNRDGVGARIDVRLPGGRRLRRDANLGEGLSAQNSATRIIGIGKASRVDELTVRWRSGKRSTVREVATGSLVTIFEDPAASPDGGGSVVGPYRPATSGPLREPKRAVPELPWARAEVTGGLRVWTTFATWCEACGREVGRLRHTRTRVGSDPIELLGVPGDPGETDKTVSAWAGRIKPPYRLALDLTPAQRGAIRSLIKQRLGGDMLPASVVTDDRGAVLLVTAGSPTVSDLRGLLARPR